MSTLKVAGNPVGGGNVTLRGPAAAVDRTLTMPDVTGTLAAQETVLGGTGQSWQSVGASRLTNGTSYTNNTPRPIQVIVSGTSSGANGSANVSVAGVLIHSAAWGSSVTSPLQCSFIVPAGATYSVTLVGYVNITWAELR